MKMKSSLVVATALLLWVASSPLSIAQQSSNLIGCLSANGTLYNLTDKPDVDPVCIELDRVVSLGSGDISSVGAGKGLNGGGDSGDIELALDPDLLASIPPRCPEGNVAVRDESGAWDCRPLPGGNHPATLWVIPGFMHGAAFDPGMLGPLGPQGGSVPISKAYIVNPGSDSVSVTCLYIDWNGALLLDLTQSQTIGGGARGYCATRGRDDRIDYAIIASDGPVLPAAKSQNLTLRAFPIDCQFPDGYEFVCTFAYE